MCVRYLDEHIGKEGFLECSQIDVDGNRVGWSDEEGKEVFTLTPCNPVKL